MPTETEQRIRRLVDYNTRGLYTHREYTWKLAQLAIQHDFFEYIELIPVDTIDELRQIAADPFAHPDDVNVFELGEGGGWGFDRREREHDYWAVRRLKEHFFPDQPMPRFEPFILVGCNEFTTARNGHVILVGDFKTAGIWDYPLQLRSPDGRTIEASRMWSGSVPHALWRKFLENEGDLRLHRHETLIWLNQDISDPSEIPIGTEVWVDRSAAPAIPPCPLAPITY